MFKWYVLTGTRANVILNKLANNLCVYSECCEYDLGMFRYDIYRVEGTVRGVKVS